MRSAVLFALVVLSAACRGDRADLPGGRVVLVTQVPAGTAVGVQGSYPPGTRVLRLDLADPAAPPLEISVGLEAAGDARLSHDAQRVVFVGREFGEASSSLWECALDGSRRRLLTPAAHACGPGAVLPDGRVAYAADAAGLGRSLFVTDGTGGRGELVTFGLRVLAGPVITRDGRLLFVARHGDWATARHRDDGLLFTVHPDGTGIAPLHHAGAGWPSVLRQAAADGAIVYPVPRSGERGRVRLLDWRAPAEAPVELELPTGPVSCVEPTAGGRLLVAASAVAGARSGLVLLDRAGTVVGGPWPDPEGWETIDVTEVARRPRPQGQLSSVNSNLQYGELACVDARHPRRAAAVTAVLREGGVGEQLGPLTWRRLGDVPLAADGSFFVRVPADTPLVVDLLDAEGRVLEESHTPFWVRPGEKRVCVGCHEEPDTTPPNRRPLAVLEPPVELGLAPPAGVGQ